MNEEEYSVQLFENILKQLNYIDMALEAALCIDEIENCDQLVDDSHTVTWLNIKTLNELRQISKSMMDKPPQQKQMETYAFSMMIIGSTLAASFLVLGKFISSVYRSNM